MGVRALTIARSGNPVIVRLEHNARNLDTGSVDSVEVDLTVLGTSDHERLVLRESGPDTGVFAGCIMVEADEVSAFDGHLSNVPNDHAIVQYADLTDHGPGQVLALEDTVIMT